MKLSRCFTWRRRPPLHLRRIFEAQFLSMGPDISRRTASASMNCKDDEDIDAKRSRPSIGKPGLGHARKERVLLIGTDQRITSGPAVKTAALKGRIHDCTRTLR